MSFSNRIFYGGIIAHCKGPRLADFQLLTSTALGVDEFGRIAFIDSGVGSAQEAMLAHDFEGAELINLHPNNLLIPGLIDTHTHAPQWENRGIGMDLPLMDWLDKYTRPTEMTFQDPAEAERVYDMVVQDTLHNGSTTVCYYATIHAESTKILAEKCFKHGQRAFVGQNCMDRTPLKDLRNSSPQQAVEATKELINRIRQFDPQFSLVTPIITPGFLPILSAECIELLVALARAENLPMQTHLSESIGDVTEVQRLYPSAKSYTHVQDAYGVLTDRTVLAHCVFLSDEERQLIAERKSGVAHCPISNINLKSGNCRVRLLLDAGIKVGLGCDCSGGHSASVLENLRRASDVSRTLSFHSAEPRDILEIHELFHMATLGGAQVCGIDHITGNFEVGKEFDAVLFDASPKGGSRNLRLKDGEDPLALFQKVLFCSDDRNIESVYVRGRLCVDNGI